MRMPFRSELDEVFRGDRSVGWKMAGAGLVTAFLVVTVTLREIRQGHLSYEPTPRLIGTLAGASALAGAGLALLLSLKDAVERRQDRGDRVHPILRLYFGRGGWSLAAWIVTIPIAMFVASMVAAFVIAVIAISIRR